MNEEQIQREIIIPNKLNKKSEAYIKMEIAKNCRQEYLTNLINDLENELDIACRLGCNVIEKQLLVYDYTNITFHQDLLRYMDREKAVIYNYITIKELLKIKEHFKSRQYIVFSDIKVDYTITDKYNTILSISFVNVED